MPRPNFFIVGAPKCGTSSMHDYLGQHPDVFMSKLKEPGYFNPDLKIVRVWEATAEDRYLTLFAKAGNARRIGESTTWYMYSKRAARLINEWDPKSKAIIMLRNPVDAVYSQHGQMLWSCNEDIPDFEEALRAEADRRQGKRISADCTSPDALQYTETFTYTPQVKRYFDTLGRERTKVILFDEFVKDTARIYRETLEFLDLDPSFQATFEVVNSVKPVSLGVNRFFARRPWLRSAVHAVIPQTVQWKMSHLLPYFTKTLKRTPKVNPELRRNLLPRFREDIERLSELLGRDLSHWCKA